MTRLLPRALIALLFVGLTGCRSLMLHSGPLRAGRCADGLPVRILLGATCDTGTCTCRPDRWMAP